MKITERLRRKLVDWLFPEGVIFRYRVSRGDNDFLRRYFVECVNSILHPGTDDITHNYLRVELEQMITRIAARQADKTVKYLTGEKHSFLSRLTGEHRLSQEPGPHG